MTNIGIEPFLAATHGLIVKFATLLLQLIIADIKSVSSKAMITHSDLVLLLTIQVINHLVIVLMVIVNSCSVHI